MNENYFPPPRQRGLLIHGILLLILASLAVWGFWSASRADVGPAFMLYILLALAAFLPLPIIGYRAYALLRANYHLGRDNLRLVWGLRVEELPLSDIEWVRPATDLTTPLRLPRLRLPGSLLGLRRHPDLGMVEFLASGTEGLLLLATAKRVFAISPADPRAFAREFQRAIELGSLTPVAARSTYPSFVVAQAWESLLARYLWLSGLLLNVGLLIWVSLLIPGLQSVPLGFSPTGEPLGPFPPVRLMLLPLVSAVLFLAGWLAGLYFYSHEEQRILAFITWGSSTLTGLLFLLAVLFAAATPI
ncbi:MAG: hypothetical protein GXP40_03150 [Chloroflexi bacterium]|nr:hypothetical protein [Chloroflexota bacterium]